MQVLGGHNAPFKRSLVLALSRYEAVEAITLPAKSSGADLVALAESHSAFRACIVTRCGSRPWQGPADHFSAEHDAAVVASHAELLRAREHERQVVGVVSRDLHTPLSLILTCADNMMHDESLGEMATRTLHRLRNNAERAVRLLDDLLDFTQERSLGRKPVRTADCDMQQLVREAVEEAALTHQRRTIEQAGEMGPIPGHWDPARVGQVLASLLDNALKFSPLDLRVRVEVNADDEQVTVAVRNWGTPLPPERLGLVFEAFQCVDPAAPAPVSLGLDLYISREIALAHGSRLDADSSAEHGTTFTLTLPRVCPPRGAGAPEAHLNSNASPRSPA